MNRMKVLVEQYGRLVVVLHLAVWFVCTGTFALIAWLGLEGGLPGGIDASVVPGAEWLEAQLGDVGLALVAGYAATQILKFPRIALTVALTPILARRLGHAPVPESDGIGTPPSTPA